ncbi:tumor necrosis factor receptor superfamily member 14 [Discoglossus pictus]
MGLLIKTFILIIHYILLVTVYSLECTPGEYQINNECCPMCSSGNVVKKHCTSQSSTECIPCVYPSYMDHPNGETKCLRCKHCDSGAGLITKDECTYITNTVCECKPGFFCPEGHAIECDLCQAHKKCIPGEWVKQPGTATSDVVCEACPFGFYSNEIMSRDCKPWTKCSDIGRTKHSDGTDTSDAICGHILRHWWLSIPCFCTIALIFVIFLFKAKTPQGSDSDCTRPQQETQPQLAIVIH